MHSLSLFLRENKHFRVVFAFASHKGIGTFFAFQNKSEKISEINFSAYFCAMKIYKQITACEAVKHFEANGWKALWPGNRNGKNKEYSWGQKIIQDAHDGKMSDTRARALLEKFGGEAYRVTSAFEVEVGDSNGPAFAEGVKALKMAECICCGADCEQRNDLVGVYKGKLYKYSAYVCKANPSHEFQTGEQMDQTLELLKR